MKKLALTLGMVVLAIAAVFAADPTMIEDSFVSSISLTNGLGRAYDIEGVYFDTTAGTTNAITLSIINTQDTDTTGTNATQAAVTYAVKVFNFDTETDWTADELIRVPSGAILYLSNSQTSTNAFIIFRDDSDD